MLHTISRQRATFIFIITLLCFIGLFSPVQGRAADLPDRAEVQSQLNTLNKQKELTPQDKLVQQDLTQTLETLDKIERIKSETAQLRQQVEQAPAKLRQAVESLNNLSDVPNDDATRKTLSTLSLRQLESRVTQTLDDLQNAQNDLATYNSQLVSLQTQPERVQNAMFNASQQLQQIRNRLNGTSVGDETLRPTQQVPYWSRFLQAAGRSGKPETVLWSVRENQGIPWASINAASSFTVMEPSDSMV